MDANGDGKLSKEEIKNGYQTHFGRTMNDEEVDEMFNKVDADGSVRQNTPNSSQQQ